MKDFKGIQLFYVFEAPTCIRYVRIVRIFCLELHQLESQIMVFYSLL